MSLVQRTRFATAFKNLTGFRGPLDLPLIESMSPVLDLLGSTRPEIDDEQAFWYSTSPSLGAVAAQFNFYQVKSTFGRAVVDWCYIRSSAAVAVYRLGITAEAAGSVGTILGNPFLNNRPLPFAVPPITLGSVLTTTATQAGDLFSTFGINIETPANTAVLFNVPPFLVATPGYAITLGTGAVNQALGASFGGRWLADQQ